jgi:hypothetical protein
MDETVPDPSTVLPALPLDSPDWVPLDIPLRWLIEHTGHPDLAAHDLIKLLATSPPYGGRSMVRLWPYEECKLLPSSYWIQHCVGWDNRRKRIWVSPSRLLGGIGPDGPIHEDVHYAWKPDLMRVWPEMFPSVPMKEVGATTTSVAVAPIPNSPPPKRRPLPERITKELAGRWQAIRAAVALWQAFSDGKTPSTLSAQRCRDQLSNAGYWKAENEEFGLTDPSSDVVGEVMNLFGRIND